MADSDDEYDRKRRDKFRGERAADAAAYSSRGSERAVRAREDWQERDGWSRPRPRDYPGRLRDRGYSPSIEPAMKRPRADYYGSGGGDYFGGPGGFAPSAYHQAAHRRDMSANVGGGGGVGDSGSGQPPMLSFKAFLATQDDNISDSDAIEKYNDYKLEFQRQQLNEFFVAHKDDEWFRIKYHPEDSAKRKDEQTNFIKKRVEVFVELLKENRLSTSLDCVHTSALVKLLDTVVIKLEGGTEQDIVALDKEYDEKEEPKLKDKDKESDEKKSEQSPCESKEIKDTKAVEPDNSNKEEGEDGEVDLADEKKDGKSDDDEGKLTMEKQEVNGKDLDAAAQRNKEKEDGGCNSEEDNEKQDERDKMESEEEKVVMDVDKMADEVKVSKKECDDKNRDSSKRVEDKDKKKAVKDKKRKRSRSYSGSSSNSSSSSGSGNSSDSDTEKDKDNVDAKSEEAKEDNNGMNVEENEGDDRNTDKAIIDANRTKDENEDDKNKIVHIKEECDKDKKPPPLHKTTSIFLRSLAPSITRQEVEAMCSRYGGFLRVALADPQPDRRWQRRGWVTFRRDANIKEICWALNNARLRDCDLGAIMNRDLSRRIRPVSGIAAHKSVVRTDIRVAARVAVHMDGKYELWKNGSAEAEQTAISAKNKFTPFGFLSHNPVLHNITDHLIEEASAEEDLLLGLEPSGGDDVGSADGTNVQVERDETLISVLDRIISYLRVVHSIDYYNHCEYPNEDEMPSRCGILHARGPAPTTRVDVSHLIGAQAENRMANFLPEVASANDVLAQGGAGATIAAATKSVDSKKTDNEQKLIVLAMKDIDAEIDKFVQSNTRELAKDKWLCPLSGKKFKGPDFVRKHIFNKHAEKIEEVKKEVEFFNNYLKDSKRPTSADQHQQQQQQQQQQVQQHQQAKREDVGNMGGGGYGGGHQQQSYGGGYGGGGYMGRYGGYGGGYARPHRGGYSHRAGRGGGGGVGGGADYRPIIHYRDLDAPREPEEFI